VIDRVEMAPLGLACWAGGLWPVFGDEKCAGTKVGRGKGRAMWLVQFIW
jgi:hypothetical protein